MKKEIKKLIKMIPLSSLIYGLAIKKIASWSVKFKIAKFKNKQKDPFQANHESNLIVSLTSFPARIENVWITVESIFQQTYKPWKVVLVLAEDEFKNRTIPQSLEQQIKRGLDIIWTDRNTRSYKKLLPTKKAYPSAKIITVDDDVIYEPWRISRLIEAEKKYPNAVIGYRGCEITVENEKIKPYKTWPPANEQSRGDNVLLTGIGGILYPPGVLCEEMLFDIESALELAPSADDIWFWAVAVLSNTKIHCLGYEKHEIISPDDQNNALFTINVAGGRNDIQLNNVIERYDLFWRIN